MLIQCDRTDLSPAAPPCGCAFSRRGFLRGAAALGIAATMTTGVKAQVAAATPRVDVHHHYTSPSLLAMMKGRRTN